MTDRQALDQLLDSQWVGTLATVADGEPWAVPMLFARDGDRVLIHGSTGAGVLRRVAAGSPAVFIVFALDSLVVAPTTFESSVNYRSAMIRGRLEPATDPEKTRMLDRLAETLIPGRTTEVRPSSRKELAATLAMALPIADDNWLLKVADEWPATPEQAGAGRRRLERPGAGPDVPSTPLSRRPGRSTCPSPSPYAAWRPGCRSRRRVGRGTQVRTRGSAAAARSARPWPAASRAGPSGRRGPGMTWLMSLMPRSRFITDSHRSPSVAITTAIRPRTTPTHQSPSRR